MANFSIEITIFNDGDVSVVLPSGQEMQFTEEQVEGIFGALFIFEKIFKPTTPDPEASEHTSDTSDPNSSTKAQPPGAVLSVSAMFDSIPDADLFPER